ncbi:NAD(P)-dependent alcohol dehydrogenase [Pseudomonas putida]|uniref:NAD(P)-dependent alcohol dehydrogenase n=1 Tax=Pseudomonas putida TaxID=303 RepID=UPI0007716F43|nr:NAD(P)-dependent alcohol dehydrogenase [Pseudomonas putida]KWW14543.1 alcohol dehydrogenase [Pseudomonas putida]MBH3346552.1 NAD(P)-dependent alcohol dehydrogenase [Pseudomonas putida]MDQ2487134.1 NAD(P)-dependent alcohol dehydrogenase [Pseudomonas putida]
MSHDNVQKMRIQAAVLRESGAALKVEDVLLEAPRPTEVRVRVVASGVCHTDMVVRDQLFPTPMPIILGHEGAGVVDAVGSAVTTVKPGDHVVMTYMSCGLCLPCETGHPAHCTHMHPLNFGGGRLDGSASSCSCESHAPIHDHFFGQSSFSTYAIANERNVVKVAKEAPLELLGPLGCGIQTGAGSVLNALKVEAGSSFVAFGAGAVGLAAVMAARVAGATTIIAVDVTPSRLELALELGATHVINSRDENPVERIQQITAGGANYSLECSGRAEVLRQAIDALATLGTCGIVGATKFGTEVAFNINDVMIPGKRIMGIVQGDVVANAFIPKLVDLYLQGRFPFDKLCKFYEFDQVNQAMADSERGVTIKPILRMPAITAG